MRPERRMPRWDTATVQAVNSSMAASTTRPVRPVRWVCPIMRTATVPRPLAMAIPPERNSPTPTTAVTLSPPTTARSDLATAATGGKSTAVGYKDVSGYASADDYCRRLLGTARRATCMAKPAHSGSRTPPVATTARPWVSKTMRPERRMPRWDTATVQAVNSSMAASTTHVASSGQCGGCVQSCVRQQCLGLWRWQYRRKGIHQPQQRR